MTKLRFWALCMILLLQVFCSKAQTDIEIDGNLTFIKLGNGLSAVVSTNPQGTTVDVACYVKTGSMFDPDSLSGVSNILQHIIANKISSNLAGKEVLNLSNSGFVSYSTTEHAVYKFSVLPAHVNTLLSLLSQNLFFASISNSDLQTAVLKVKQDLQTDSTNYRTVFDHKILKTVFRKDFEKLIPSGSVADFVNITEKSIRDFYLRYYVPNNTLLAVNGNITYAEMNKQLQGEINDVIKSDFDPESVTKIVDMHPMLYTSHFVYDADVTQPEFNICWQFPGAMTNTESSYAAYLLSAMLNDKNNFIQAKARKLGCKKFVAQYEVRNFSAMLRIILQPDKSQLIPTLELVTNEMGRLEKTLLNESMINAGKLQFKKEWTQLENTPDYPEWIVRYWAYKDDSYFSGLLDTVMGVREDELKKFVIDYLNIQPHVVGLLISKADRESLKVDSLFTDVNELVSNYVFKFRHNICDIEGAENFVMQRNILQFLKANKDVNIQVNGLADEGEFNQVADDSVLAFIDSLPNFRKTMPEKVKKGYLKPEMMRAVKLLKYFYENGIDPERLSGTCMKFSSSNSTEAADNMKCSVTLDKMRKAPSVYEFHYGKKKQ